MQPVERCFLSQTSITPETIAQFISPLLFIFRHPGDFLGRPGFNQIVLPTDSGWCTSPSRKVVCQSVCQYSAGCLAADAPSFLHSTADKDPAASQFAEHDTIGYDIVKLLS